MPLVAKYPTEFVLQIFPRTEFCGDPATPKPLSSKGPFPSGHRNLTESSCPPDFGCLSCRVKTGSLAKYHIPIQVSEQTNEQNNNRWFILYTAMGPGPLSHITPINFQIVGISASCWYVFKYILKAAVLLCIRMQFSQFSGN